MQEVQKSPQISKVQIKSQSQTQIYAQTAIQRNYIPKRYQVDQLTKPHPYNASETQKLLQQFQQQLQQQDSLQQSSGKKTVKKEFRKTKENILERIPENIIMTEKDEFIQTQNLSESKENSQKQQETIVLNAKNSNSSFKGKPMKRMEQEMLKYKEIFVEPKENELLNLKDKEKDFEKLFHVGTQKQYDKILKIYEEERGVIAKFEEDIVDGVPIKKTRIKSAVMRHSQSLKEEISQRFGNQMESSPQKELEKVLHENMAVLEQALHLESKTITYNNFFDQQIQVQPPDQPNATIASPLTPGNGYAPSIPLTPNQPQSLSDLLTLTKAGTQAGDIQKEAHLSYHLANIYQTTKNLIKAIKFYKKFMTAARLMEDKIGLALAANRIGVCLGDLGYLEKSLEYHKQNLQLSDQDNLFVGWYNLGLIQRWAKNQDEAIANFVKALEWARNRDEIESECLSYGQLGVVYHNLGQQEEALNNFSNCYELSRRLKNVKLQLDCLLSISKITSLSNLRNTDSSVRVLQDAVDCAKVLGDKKTASLCMCNLGVIQGGQNYDVFSVNQDLNKLSY